MALFGGDNEDIFSKSLPKDSPKVEKKTSSTAKPKVADVEDDDEDDDLFSGSTSK